MSDKSRDLPGFYRDPETGRYFRDNPAVAKNQSLEKLKKENETRSKISEESSTNISKYSDIFKFLHAREIGSTSGVLSERDYCKMSACNKKLHNAFSLNSCKYVNVAEVNYIRGTPSFVLGVWATNEKEFESSIIMNQCLHKFLKFKFYKVCAHHITDLCEGPDRTVIYTFNNPLARRSGLVSVKLQPTHNFDSFVSQYKKISKSPLYCCSSTIDGKYFAVGSDHMISYYDHISHEGHLFPVFNAARVHAISFDRSSNLMATGLHNGYVSLYDLRLHKIVTNFKVSDYCINDSHFLEDNQVIVAGLENVLCGVDLRMNRVVTEYFSHRTSPKKSALSIANNMLCASGVDNVVRIWHLSGGDPIHQMNPYFSPDNKAKGWLFNQDNKTYLYHFEAGLRKAYVLT